jgi:hypothetical protein
MKIVVAFMVLISVVAASAQTVRENATRQRIISQDNPTNVVPVKSPIKKK